MAHCNLKSFLKSAENYFLMKDSMMHKKYMYISQIPVGEKKFLDKES